MHKIQSNEASLRSQSITFSPSILLKTYKWSKEGVYCWLKKVSGLFSPGAESQVLRVGNGYGDVTIDLLTAQLGPQCSAKPCWCPWWVQDLFVPCVLLSSYLDCSAFLHTIMPKLLVTSENAQVCPKMSPVPPSSPPSWPAPEHP